MFLIRIALMAKLNDVAPQNKDTRTCIQEFYLYWMYSLTRFASRGCVISQGQNMRRVFMGSTPIRVSNLTFFSLSRPLNEYLSQELYCFQLHFKITNFHSYNMNGPSFH